MSCVENGKSVVQIYWNNSQSEKYPKGKFPSIFIGKNGYEFKENQEYELLLPNNPLFTGNPKLTPGSNDVRLQVEKVSTDGYIDVVAKWKDGVPLAAVRTDLKGLIISLGIECGQYGC